MAETTQPTNAVIVARLDNLISDVTEIKDSLRCHIESQDKFERNALVEHARIGDRGDAAHRRLDETEKRIKALEDAIQPIIYANKVMTWIGGILALSVIGLIWMIITQQVRLVFP